jgi:hypothetical protein
LHDVAIRIDCYAKTYNTAVLLSDAVLTAVLDYNGVVGSVTIQQVSLNSRAELVDMEVGLYRISLDFGVYYY